MIKAVSDFLFGKKPPIFNKKGEIDHKRKEALKKWKEEYEKSESHNWKHHSGTLFKEDK